MSNGLDALTRKRDEARAKRKGSMPPPMFKPRETPVEIPTSDEDQLDVEVTTPEAGEDRDVDRQQAEDASQAEEARQAAEKARAAEEARQAAQEKQRKDEEAPQAEEQKQRKAKESVTDEPADIQIPAYITKSQDKFIQDVLRDGRYVKPRITSQTAVIRYALRRMMEQQSPEQVIKGMQRHAVEVASTKSGPGRPRG